MFPFHRKHGSNPNSCKQSAKRRAYHRESEEIEMSDEEYLEYIHNNDRSKHQLTSGAHDRYCTQIIRDKEEVLLSALNTVDTSLQPTNSYRLGPSTNNIFKCLLDEGAASKMPANRGESLSLPSSPTENRNFLRAENVSRRKSDTMTDTSTSTATATMTTTTVAVDHRRPARANLDDEYILTLKIDNLASDLQDVSFYRIGRNAVADDEEDRGGGGDDDDDDEDDEKYEFADDSITDLSQLSSCESSPVKTIDYNYVQCKQLENETAMRLRKLLIGSTNKPFPGQWLRQCFNFCHISASRWRLVQIKSGSCGVIAAVEAFLVKSLLFEPGYCKFKEPLRPNQKEVADAFIQAVSYILWQAGNFQKSAILIPKSTDNGGNVVVKQSNNGCCEDGNGSGGDTETFIYAEYYDFETLKEAVTFNIKYFTNPPYNGYLNFVMSVVMSRGIFEVENDMDDEGPLITENGHCSLELVMLLITGQATSNVFDDNIQIDSCLLKGVKKDVDVGFLSLFEHMNTCEVGSRLKSPKFPIWLVNCSDHFTVLFSNKYEHAHHTIEQPFVLYHYDSMTAFSCENDIKLVIDPIANYSNEQLGTDQTHLQLCIRTKWKNAIVIYADNSELLLV